MATPLAQGQTHRIMGIDPGLRVTGYGILEWQSHGPAAASTPANRPPLTTRDHPAFESPLFGMNKRRIRIVEAGVIRVAAGRPLESRLRELKQSLDEILQERRPTCMAVEQLYAHYERTQPAILMGHARGVILLAAAQADLSVTSYAATAVKKAVSGSGRAPKPQMQAAVCQHLGLSVVPEPHDVADALAVALCHLFAQSNPLLGLESKEKQL